MAFRKIVIIFAVVAIVCCNHRDEVKTEDKTKKALASEKEQKSRSANPGRGSFQQLSSMLNKTDERRNRRRGKETINKILQLNRKHENMMNDNEGVAIKQKTVPDNDSYSLADKMKILRPIGLTYEAVNRNNYVSQATGVFCNFENSTDNTDMCKWQWNSTISSHGLGFKVVTGADLIAMNETTRGLKFTGPIVDADGNANGECLHL